MKAARHAIRAWPVSLSLLVYAAILIGASIVAAPMGIIGGFLIGFVLAACWSSYLDLLSQAVAGSRIRVRWDEFKRTFGAHFWDVISVMFAFWIISMLTGPATRGPNGAAVAAIMGIAIAFFFNAVPELLYQGSSRSFSLLLDSARFMLANPVAWLLPNVVFAGVILSLTGRLDVSHPAELLVVFGNAFSSPAGVASIVAGMPLWALPLAPLGLHFVMVFRGLLFKELSSGRGSARLRDFQARQR